jgi:hypothetical protein
MSMKPRTKGVGYGNKKPGRPMPEWARPEFRARSQQERSEYVRKLREEKGKENRLESTEKLQRENIVVTAADWAADWAAYRGANPAVLREKGLGENVNGGFRMGVAERESER